MTSYIPIQYYNFAVKSPQSFHAMSLATSASIASGEVVEAQRWTTLPSLSTKNFSKFHYVSSNYVSNSIGRSNSRGAHLDTAKTQQPGLVPFEILVHFVRVIAIDIRLLHKWEVYTMIAFAESCNLVICARFLTTELEQITERSIGADEVDRQGGALGCKESRG